MVIFFTDKVEEIKSDVEDRKKIIAENNIDYSLWINYYTGYRRLMDLAILNNISEFRELAEDLGQSLVDADVISCTPSEQDLLGGYVKEIQKDLGISKTLDKQD